MAMRGRKVDPEVATLAQRNRAALIGRQNYVLVGREYDEDGFILDHGERVGGLTTEEMLPDGRMLVTCSAQGVYDCLVVLGRDGKPLAELTCQPHTGEWAGWTEADGKSEVHIFDTFDDAERWIRDQG